MNHFNLPPGVSLRDLDPGSHEKAQALREQRELDKADRKADDAINDETNEESYAALCEQLAKDCECTGNERSCAGLLAGGGCDSINQPNQPEEDL